MGVQLVFMLIKLFLAVTALLVHGSAGFDIPSLRAASVLLHFKIGTRDFGSYRTTRASQTFLQNAPPSFGQKRHRSLVPESPNKVFHHLLPEHHSPAKAPSQNPMRHSKTAFAPSTSSFKRTAKKWIQGYASSPSLSYFKHHHARKKVINFAPEPSNQLHSPTHSPQGGPSISPLHSPFPSSTGWSSPAPAPLSTTLSNQFNMPVPPPTLSSSSSSQKEKKTPPPSPILVLPPPPPNGDCTSVTCTEPLTYSPPGSPCGCVWPIEVRLSVSVALYTFFPLVSELAKEIATGISLNRSQVRIMGANADSQQLEKTIVLINLVPLGENFNHSTAFLIYKKFWHKLVSIKTSLFGAYEVVYVRYPGLPPSPPSVPSSAGIIGDKPFPGHGNNGRGVKPIPVDVPRKQKNRLGGSMIAVIVLSSATAFVVLMGAIWLLLLRCGGCRRQPYHSPHVLVSSQGKPSGAAVPLRFGSRPSSETMSFSSSLLSYTGTAKIFSLNDIERATDNFEASRILGEGGFGLVYSGILEDGRKVAVKVLKRDDRQGSREFLAEVEMLSRLHHRNLVKLIGICSEDHTRCLVYELVPNGSVESHLHGADKEAAPLDWGARMKIALGAARGLAYLHEDSSPRVIHRDFKSSNILLEEDFTPKVSDFGLARTALDEGNKHISTHVMGTFGYLAPEYAMTGHLLVKSDVYSYGVVLLELLTGRKPVDLSQPPGQENLVAWVRPLLTTKEGLETIIDPGIKSNNTFDSVVKVAAIASMCVQPEVSHRPFMGEVVQALKLVCNEFDETIEPALRSSSQEDLCVVVDSKLTRASGELVKASFTHYPMSVYDSTFDSKIVLSASDLVSVSARFEEQEHESYTRVSNSAPLGMGKKRKFWQRLRGSSKGSVSEHGFSLKLWPGSH
ncbi:receptor-like serine/threonine-protein kinase ALE2 [Cornus florida]|uniref:receptor-like serine/threonine-protein kinase ALE2 n=1 Tax=Cornus florida TaxID=4283 RepID=UPI0028999929|nr:receptor-like serine/threonine-protein kinase ALE2 [Cornus florida]XP_059641370.1 receptor-like serine/threonine-protein kinase ALE2 [Cornus florida]